MNVLHFILSTVACHWPRQDTALHRATNRKSITVCSRWTSTHGRAAMPTSSGLRVPADADARPAKTGIATVRVFWLATRMRALRMPRPEACPSQSLKPFRMLLWRSLCILSCDVNKHTRIMECPQGQRSTPKFYSCYLFLLSSVHTGNTQDTLLT